MFVSLVVGCIISGRLYH